ncbi:MAG: carbohydrate ABC transporter substrate-binding protein [Clostridia bacterium]|nr:carbohydrate ABC transporter substrate-binding protein [Clostridia bacterium]
MKKVISLLLILVLVVAMGICAAGCKSTGEKQDEGGKFADKIPGGSADVSAEVLEALTNSGSVSSYVFGTDDTAGRPANLGGLNNVTFQELFREVYGGEIELSNIPWEGWESKFISDFAAESAPDMIYGFAKLWPKIANRGMVFSNKELKEMGIVGLDHPVLKDGFEAVEANFTYKNEVYGLALHRSGCFWSIVNEDLYKKYNVKSPSAYYKEGLWDIDALSKCSNELITAAGLNDAGVREVFGYYCWDSTAFIRANGQQLIGFDGATGALSNNCKKLEVIEAMENLRKAFQEGWATTDDQVFAKGNAGIIAVTDENVTSNISNLTFDYSIIPFPKGRSNKNNQLPGSVSAWMVTTSSDNVQGAVNLIIAYLAAVEDGTLPLGDNCVESSLKDQPEVLQMILDSKIHGVNDNMYGVGTLWSAQWDFWRQIRTGKTTVAETVEAFSSLFDAQIEAEMANTQ